MVSSRRREAARVATAIVVAGATSFVFFGFGRAGPDTATPGYGAAWTDAELAMIATLSPLPALPASPSNRVADDPRAAQLGKQLFFDTRLSKDGSLACVSCHKPSLYFTDGQRTAVGLNPVRRHTPTIIGSQWSRFFFWDGRKDSLWSQALGPLEAEAELGTTRSAVARVVFEHYRQAYEELFGPMLPATDHDDPEVATRVFVGVGKCIEAYERKLVPREAPFDRYVADLRKGDPKGGGHLSRAAIRGLRAFIGRAGCVHCHNGPLFMDASFHNTGLPPGDPEAEPDPARARGAWQVLADPFRSDGRYSDAEGRPNPDLDYLNPGFQDLVGAYKTPTLRNIAMTPPYGHAGQFRSLAAVIEHYRRLPVAKFPGHRDLILKPLDDTVATADLVAFLRSLTGPRPDAAWLSRR